MFISTINVVEISIEQKNMFAVNGKIVSAATKAQHSQIQSSE